MPGEVVEDAGRHEDVRGSQDPIHPRVGEPHDEGHQQTEVAQAVGWKSFRDRDRQRRHCSIPTISSVVSATATPAALKASSLLLAVPRLPEMIAPAWPMRLPSGAVRPEMKATVLSRLPRPSSSAACSSSLPPISPMTTRWVVAGSCSKSSITSLKANPR